MTAVIALAGACSGDTEESEPEGSPAGSSSQSDAPTEVETDGLPVDFPRDEVPVVEGDIVSVSVPDNRDQAFTLLLNAGESTPVNVVSQAVLQLEDAGWTALTEVEGEPPVPQVLTQDGGEANRVIITSRSQDAETLLTYSVAIAG